MGKLIGTLLLFLLLGHEALGAETIYRYSVKNRKSGLITHTWVSDATGKDYYEEGFGRREFSLPLEDATPEQAKEALRVEEVEGRKFYRMPADYEIIVKDITPERDLQEAQRQADNSRREKLKKAADLDKMTLVELSQIVRLMRDQMLREGRLDDLPKETLIDLQKMHTRAK